MTRKDVAFSTAELQARTFKRGAKVRFVTDLSGLVAGTEGKVAMANGLVWHRYWVRLPDGRVLGHVDHNDLVLSKHYELYQAALKKEAEQVLTTTEQDKPDDETQQNSSAQEFEDVTVNGVTVPGYLLQRSAAARIRLGV